MSLRPSQIHVTKDISIASEEIKETFVRANGLGGQNINKVSSAVQLRLNARRYNTLLNTIYFRLKASAGRRMTTEGIVIIEANRLRSQHRNR